MAPAGAEKVFLNGPRTPAWGCTCGCRDNWANRLRCRACNRWAATSIQDRAKAADAEAVKRSRSRRTGSGRSSSPGSGHVEELETERKKRRDLAAEVKRLKAGAQQQDDDEDGLPAEVQVREKHLQALTKDLGKEHPIVEALRKELEEERTELRGSKPLAVRQKALLAKIGRLSDSQTKDLAKQHELEQELEAARKKLHEHNEKMLRNKEVLAKAEEELSQLKVQAASQDDAVLPDPDFWHLLSDTERVEPRWVEARGQYGVLTAEARRKFKEREPADARADVPSAGAAPASSPAKAPEAQQGRILSPAEIQINAMSDEEWDSFCAVLGGANKRDDAAAFFADKRQKCF